MQLTNGVYMFACEFQLCDIAHTLFACCRKSASDEAHPAWTCARHIPEAPGGRAREAVCNFSVVNLFAVCKFLL